ADQTAMDKAAAEKAVDSSTRKNFAANQIVVIVPHDARVQPATLADLTGAGYQRIALGNPASVPFGRYTKAALEQAG
ncbi:molybdate ABC transporter substrate-binding protein, partial [Salmonella enterica]